MFKFPLSMILSLSPRLKVQCRLSHVKRKSQRVTSPKLKILNSTRSLYREQVILSKLARMLS